MFEVTRSFYTIGKARRFVSATEAAVASMESNLNLASNRFLQGSVLKSDLLDADVRLAEARENLVLARNALATSESIFRNVGIGETGNVTVVEVEFRATHDSMTSPLDVSQEAGATGRAESRSRSGASGANGGGRTSAARQRLCQLRPR